jgi:hypothetical protein
MLSAPAWGGSMGVATGILLIAATIASFLAINVRASKMSARRDDGPRIIDPDTGQRMNRHGSGHHGGGHGGSSLGGHHGGGHAGGAGDGGGHFGGFSGGDFGGGHHG